MHAAHSTHIRSFFSSFPSSGYSRTASILMVAGLVLNTILDPLFIFGWGPFPSLGIAGVAIATIVSQILSATFVVICLIRAKGSSFCLDLKKLRIYRSKLMIILKTGVPAGIQGSFFSVSNVLIQSSINSFGSVAMAGNGAAGNIEGFVYVAMNAFHHAALTFTSQNLGARNIARIKKVAVLCTLIVTAVGLAVGGGAMLAAKPLLSIYDSNPEVIYYGVLRMQIICLTYFGCGIMDVMAGLMRGLGYSIAPTIVSLIGACLFRVFWIYTFFAWNPTLPCLYTSYPISWGLTSAAHAVCFVFALRSVKKKLEQTAA